MLLQHGVHQSCNKATSENKLNTASLTCQTQLPPRLPSEGLCRTDKESLLTYISCVVHKNAAFATFDGGTLSLGSGKQGEGDLGSDQDKSGGSQGSLGTAGPSSLLSFCTGREDGGLQASCSCVPGPAAEVAVR